MKLDIFCSLKNAVIFKMLKSYGTSNKSHTMLFKCEMCSPHVPNCSLNIYIRCRVTNSLSDGYCLQHNKIAMQEVFLQCVLWSSVLKLSSRELVCPL
uniref:Uncharacterized protein n=1 Tax=Arundo donax TaxID=35708 RepID=A0A0A9HFH2_ARUDO